MRERIESFIKKAIAALVGLAAIFTCIILIKAGTAIAVTFGAIGVIVSVGSVVAGTRAEERDRLLAAAQASPDRNIERGVPPLLDLSARAVDPTKAWEHLAELSGVNPQNDSPSAREKVAAALAENNVDGLDKHLEKLAAIASLLPKVMAHYAAKERSEWAQSHSSGREPLLER